jgi:hypothetical protein
VDGLCEGQKNKRSECGDESNRREWKNMACCAHLNKGKEIMMTIKHDYRESPVVSGTK